MWLYYWKRVAHKDSGRIGRIIYWTLVGDDTVDMEAGRMIVLFEDGEVEKRWITAFVDA